MSDLEKVKREILKVKSSLPERSGVLDILLDESDGTVIVIDDDHKRMPWSIAQFRHEYAHLLQ